MKEELDTEKIYRSKSQALKRVDNPIDGLKVNEKEEDHSEDKQDDNEEDGEEPEHECDHDHSDPSEK